MAEPFDEFLRSLNANGVEYVVVGGHAVMLHGYPRSTDDLDILYSQFQVNAERLTAAVAAYVPEATPEDFLGPSDVFITLMLRGHRLGLLPEIDGVVTASSSGAASRRTPQPVDLGQFFMGQHRAEVRMVVSNDAQCDPSRSNLVAPNPIVVQHEQHR